MITVCDGPRRRGAYTSDRLPAGERFGVDFGVVAPKVDAMLPHRLPPPSLASLMASIRMVSMITCTQSRGWHHRRLSDAMLRGWWMGRTLYMLTIMPITTYEKTKVASAG